MNKNKYLENKNIVITGASSGIGKALAQGFADRGASVGMIARSTDKLEAISNDITNKGGFATFSSADVSEYESVKSALADLHDELGGIDVLVNNAGIGQYNAHETSKEGIDRLVDVNFKGVLYTSALAVPYLKVSPLGVIVNSSSIESRPPFGMGYIYASTKSAINRLASFQHPSGLFAANNIKVNSIRIGFVDTPIFGPTPDAIVDRITQRYTKITGLKPANPSDLVPYFGFFASEDGKDADHRIVDMVYIEQARKHLADVKLDTLDWDKLNNHLSEVLGDEGLANIKENQDLLHFLLNS